ncbi:pentapeptide repeat-containing protein [Patescibacteria group bacterium]|nr:pentapeptide repeat-containing protein [Patescibacteria group bacterium]
MSMEKMMRKVKESKWRAPSTVQLVQLLNSGQDGALELKKLMKKHPKWKPDFRGADLREAYLIEVYLKSADLSGAVLSGADLRGADLSGANLSGAVLRGTVLIGAVLAEANLTDADLSRANLTDADLQGAIFSKAKVCGVNWWCANIAHAKGMRRADAEICMATFIASLEFVD